MLLVKNDFNFSSKDISLLSNEASDCGKLKNSLIAFVNDTINKGPAYESLKKYINSYCIPVVENRIKAAEELMQQCSLACNNLSSYMGGDTLLDDSRIDELKSKYSSTSSRIQSLDARAMGELTDEQLSTILKSRNNLSSSLSQISNMIKKLEALSKNVAHADSIIDGASDILSVYMSTVNNYSGLSGSLNKYTYTPSVHDETTDTDDEAPIEDENNAPRIPTYIPDGSQTSYTSTNDNNDSMPILGSLVGLTAKQLSEDKDNGVYSSSNYNENESWNTKFVNDILNRDKNNKELLSGYYNNYNNPYSSIDSLYEYATNSNSNITYNWSNSSLKKLQGNNNNYSPKEGDIVFLDSNNSFNGDTSNYYPDRVGIIESITTSTDIYGKTKTTITIVEGDSGSDSSSSTVSRIVYDIDSESILGYGTVSNNQTSNI